MNRITLTTAVLIFCFRLTFSQIPAFTLYEIGETDEELLGQASLVDMDNDKDLDFVVGSSGGSVWWFEYISADNWQRHKIGDNSLTDKGGVTIDVDGDGNLDHVAGGCWYKNTGDPKKEFIRYENGVIYAYDMIAGDINGDGKNEIIALSEQEGLYWYDFSSNPTKKWKKVKIGDGISGGIYPNGLANMDYDKDMDLVRSNVWFDNLAGDGTKWSIHRTISFAASQGKYAYSTRVLTIDWDKDGDIDIVQADANNPNGSIAWHENKDGKGINWYTHPIGTKTGQDLHSLCVADFDNDGDMDVFSGAGPLTSNLYKLCIIWENTDGHGTSWKSTEILKNIESIDAVAGDVDGDGDIDICSKPWKGNKPYFLKNMLMESK